MEIMLENKCLLLGSWFLSQPFRGSEPSPAQSLRKYRSELALMVSPAWRLAIKERHMVNKRGRDSKTGAFIPIDEAKRRPNTTTVETIPPPKKPTKPKGK